MSVSVNDLEEMQCGERRVPSLKTSTDLSSYVSAGFMVNSVRQICLLLGPENWHFFFTT